MEFILAHVPPYRAGKIASIIRGDPPRYRSECAVFLCPNSYRGYMASHKEDDDLPGLESDDDMPDLESVGSSEVIWRGSIVSPRA